MFAAKLQQKGLFWVIFSIFRRAIYKKLEKNKKNTIIIWMFAKKCLNLQRFSVYLGIRTYIRSILLIIGYFLILPSPILVVGLRVKSKTGGCKRRKWRLTSIFGKAFIKRFVSWPLEIWQFHYSVTEQGNDRCSWVICTFYTSSYSLFLN